MFIQKIRSHQDKKIVVKVLVEKTLINLSNQITFINSYTFNFFLKIIFKQHILS